MNQTVPFEIVADRPRPAKGGRSTVPLALFWEVPGTSVTESDAVEVLQTQKSGVPGDVTVRRAKSALARSRRDINAIVKHCHARRAANWYGKAKQRLHHLARLPANWNSYGAQTPNRRALFWAGEALEMLVSLKLEPAGVMPSAENGVAIIFKCNGRHADIEFFNDGDIAYLTDDGINMPQAYDITADKESVGIAMHRISVFLNA